MVLNQSLGTHISRSRQGVLKLLCPGHCASGGWSIIPSTKRAHTQVTGSIPSQGAYSLMFSSHIKVSFTLSLPLSSSHSKINENIPSDEDKKRRKQHLTLTCTRDDPKDRESLADLPNT